MKEKGLYLLEADIARQIYIKEDPELASVGHFHEGMEIVAIVEGEVEAYHLTRKETLRKGEIFFADSFVCHYYKNLTPQIKAIVIVLSSEYTSIFRELYKGWTLPAFMKDGENNVEILAIMKKWLEEENKNFMLNVGYCNLLLSKIVEKYDLVKSEGQKDKNVSIKLLKYINENYTEDISLTSVSKEIGYSKEYCSKIFSEAVGMSFRDYLNFLRLKKVHEYFSMKKDIKMTTTEIVYKCGFNSTATFYRTQKAFAAKNIKI
jgi:AraC-like DNA-binding protein/quercetin dioxygenase-like cupin family protein